MVNSTALVLVWLATANQRVIMESLNLLLEKAKNSEKAKDVFIAAMSHEFRNPLNSTLCSIDVLKGLGIDTLTQQQLELL